jgi:hypothetical protein
MYLLLKKNIFLSISTFLIGVLLSILFMFVYTFYLSNKFLDWPNITFFYFGWFFQILIANIALYLRSFLEELLMMPSLIGSLINTFFLLIVSFFSFQIVFSIGFFLSSLFIFIASLFILKSKVISKEAQML